MNEDGEKIKKKQCPKCIYSKYSPDCICATKGKCEYFKKWK